MTIESGWEFWKTTKAMSAVSPHSGNVLIPIPEGVEIAVVFDPKVSDPGHVRVRWDGFENGTLSLSVLEATLLDSAVPVS